MVDFLLEFPIDVVRACSLSRHMFSQRSRSTRVEGKCDSPRLKFVCGFDGVEPIENHALYYPLHPYSVGGMAAPPWKPKFVSKLLVLPCVPTEYHIVFLRHGEGSTIALESVVNYRRRVNGAIRTSLAAHLGGQCCRGHHSLSHTINLKVCPPCPPAWLRPRQCAAWGQRNDRIHRIQHFSFFLRTAAYMGWD